MFERSGGSVWLISVSMVALACGKASTGTDAGDSSGTCAVQADCAADRTCEIQDWKCGTGIPKGICLFTPGDCGTEGPQACSCDGKVYPNVCSVYAAKSDLDRRNGCTAPAGFFKCGYSFCNAATQWCQSNSGSAYGTPAVGDCVALPASCGSSPACGCLTMPSCNGGTLTCSGDASSGVTTLCAIP